VDLGLFPESKIGAVRLAFPKEHTRGDMRPPLLEEMRWR